MTLPRKSRYGKYGEWLGGEAEAEEWDEGDGPNHEDDNFIMDADYDPTAPAAASDSKGKKSKKDKKQRKKDKKDKKDKKAALSEMAAAEAVGGDAAGQADRPKADDDKVWVCIGSTSLCTHVPQADVSHLWPLLMRRRLVDTCCPCACACWAADMGSPLPSTWRSTLAWTMRTMLVARLCGSNTARCSQTASASRRRRCVSTCV